MTPNQATRMLNILTAQNENLDELVRLLTKRVYPLGVPK